MPDRRVVTEVSSTVRRNWITPAKVRRLVATTLERERIRDATISVTFVGRRTIARLNEEYLGHKGVTDVISFGMLREAPGIPATGDIYICPDVARRNAGRNRIPISEELARLVVHGTLHVAGYDHPEDETRTHSPMWKKQERILASAD